MDEMKGWKDGAAQFDFLDIFQCGMNAQLDYNGIKIVFACGDNPATIRYGDEQGLDNGEIIGTYNTEEFYNAVVFGKSIQQIVDESILEYLF